MGTKSKTVAAGTCPQCDGALTAARVPSDKDYADAFDRENPGTLRPGSDTAAPAQRAALGALHRCTSCGYETRVAADDGGTATAAA